AMMNVMLLSVAVWSGAEGATREMLHWISAAIALPAVAFTAQPFFKNAFSALRVGRLNMDVPISLAILLACAMSLFEVINGGQHAWFDAALSLTFFLLAGRVLDQRLRRAARSAADNLAALEPSRVQVLRDGVRTNTAIAEVGVGDMLWIAAGGRVPVDAVLLEKSALVDRSAISGESDPIQTSADATLIAGDILLDGPHHLRATRVGEDTTLRRIAQMVATAESARGTFRTLADRAAEFYTPAVHIISAAAFVGWWLATQDVRTALNVAIATLIITCPCALGLAVPSVAVAATGRLFREGLLVKSDTALERMALIDTVVFDKTGTLTERRLAVPKDMSQHHKRVLRALADTSNHPLSKGLSKTLANVAPASLFDLHEEAGVGVSGEMRDGTSVSLGRGEGGDTVLRVGDVEHVLDSVETMLPGARETVALLQKANIPVHMLTGDGAENARNIAGALGIENVSFGLSPQEKVGAVADLQAGGRSVLMVGDGLNDTPALAAADASIAPSSALDVSRNAADVNFVSGDLSKLVVALGLAKTARRRILENFALSVGYNAIAIPIALAGLATPLAAAIAMSASSITVVLNAQRGMRG
ncbi:MAG: copper-translocating P-type ATPase, partial [Paracoccaceae bacterium]